MRIAHTSWSGRRSNDEYDALKNSRPEDIEIHSRDDLLTAPIRYRIAARMSVDEFGRRVGVSARQIVRYESEGYQNITSSTLQKILKGLSIHSAEELLVADIETSPREPRARVECIY